MGHEKSASVCVYLTVTILFLPIKANKFDDELLGRKQIRRLAHDLSHDAVI